MKKQFAFAVNLRWEKRRTMLQRLVVMFLICTTFILVQKIAAHAWAEHGAHDNTPHAINNTETLRIAPAVMLGDHEARSGFTKLPRKNFYMMLSTVFFEHYQEAKQLVPE